MEKSGENVSCATPFSVTSCSDPVTSYRVRRQTPVVGAPIGIIPSPPTGTAFGAIGGSAVLHASIADNSSTSGSE